MLVSWQSCNYRLLERLNLICSISTFEVAHLDTVVTIHLCSRRKAHSFTKSVRRVRSDYFRGLGEVAAEPALRDWERKFAAAVDAVEAHVVGAIDRATLAQAFDAVRPAYQRGLHVPAAGRVQAPVLRGLERLG